jgi:hypothetical protein
MNRRGFFSLIGGAAVAAIALPELELLVPTRTIFLPPAGGWIGRGNQLFTIKMISEEAMRVLSQNMEFMSEIDREYDRSFIEVSDDAGKTFKRLPLKQSGTVQVFRPPRYDLRVGDKITIGGVKWPS